MGAFSKLKQNPVMSGIVGLACGFLIYKAVQKYGEMQQEAQDEKYSGGGSATSGDVTLGRFQVQASELQGSKAEVVKRLRDKFKPCAEPKLCEKMVIGETSTLKVYASESCRISKVVVMYVHGGQYVAGSADSYTDVLETFAKETRLPVYALDYSLCPENSLEQALKDTISVYKSLRRNYYVHLVADGCGGNLVLRMGKELLKESLAPESVSMFALVDSYADEPLKTFAENFLVEDVDELKHLEVQDALSQLTQLKCAKYSGSGVTISEMQAASKMILEVESGKKA